MIDVLKVNTAELEVGMYVSSLDRPWLDSPFSLQGFRIESESEIERLQNYCHYVYIDSQRSAQEKAQLACKQAYSPRTSLGRIFLDRRLKVYKDSSDWSREFPQAEVAVAALTEGIDLLTQETTSDGRPLEIVNSLEPEAYGIDMTAIQL